MSMTWNSFTLVNFSSIHRLLELFDEYKKASGASLNHDKTQILVIGNFNHIPEKFKKFLVPCIKIYGVYFNNNGFDVPKSFEPAREKIYKLLSTRAHSEFSLESRSIYISTFFLSKFFYTASFMSPQKIFWS